MYSFPNLEPVCCSKTSSNCCFLTSIHISQERGQVVWYSHLLKNFPQFVVIHTVRNFGVVQFSSVHFNSVVQSFSTLCHPMNWSTPDLPVHHQLPEFTQTYAHRVGDVIQPSHPLSSPSPPAPNSSQHQDLFQ